MSAKLEDFFLFQDIEAEQCTRHEAVRLEDEWRQAFLERTQARGWSDYWPKLTASQSDRFVLRSGQAEEAYMYVRPLTHRFIVAFGDKPAVFRCTCPFIPRTSAWRTLGWGGDLYLWTSELEWTMVLTHEDADMGGPFFVYRSIADKHEFY